MRARDAEVAAVVGDLVEGLGLCEVDVVVEGRYGARILAAGEFAGYIAADGGPEGLYKLNSTTKLKIQIKF